MLCDTGFASSCFTWCKHIQQFETHFIFRVENVFAVHCAAKLNYKHTCTETSNVYSEICIYQGAFDQWGPWDQGTCDQVTVRGSWQASKHCPFTNGRYFDIKKIMIFEISACKKKLYRYICLYVTGK